MANAQEQTWAAGDLARTDGDTAQRPRMLILGPSDCGGTAVVSLMASSLIAEGWSASAANATAGKPILQWRPTSLRKAMNRLTACDAVHIVCTSAGQIVRDALPSLVLARFVGKRSVLHFVTPEIETLLERRRRLLTPLLRLASGVVVGSRHLQKVLARAGVDARVLTAPVSLEGLNHRVRSKLQPRILVVTSLEADANVQAAIRAFRLVKQKYPRAEIVIAGDGPQRRNLELLAERANVAGISFLGYVDQASVARAMDECDLFLHAPLADESPTALVRAFAAGLPAVTSDADGLLHMVRDRVNALIVPIGDHVGLSNAILELVENEELCIKLSQQGKQESEKYSWARVRQDWVNLYNTLRSTS